MDLATAVRLCSVRSAHSTEPHGGASKHHNDAINQTYKGEGEGSSLWNRPVIPREFASLTRSPRHDDQSTRTAEYEAPLTLALSLQSRGEGTKQAAQGLTTNSRLHPF